MKNKLYLALGILIGACAGGTTTLADGSLREIHTSTDPGELTDDEFDRVTIDGKPCIIWKDKRGANQNAYAYSGLTCDWRDR